MHAKINAPRGGFSGRIYFVFRVRENIMIKFANLATGLIAPAVYICLKSGAYVGVTLSISSDFWWYDTREDKKRYHLAALALTKRPGSITLTLIVLFLNVKLLAGKNVDIDIMETT